MCVFILHVDLYDLCVTIVWLWSEHSKSQKSVRHNKALNANGADNDQRRTNTFFIPFLKISDRRCKRDVNTQRLQNKRLV